MKWWPLATGEGGGTNDGLNTVIVSASWLPWGSLTPEGRWQVYFTLVPIPSSCFILLGSLTPSFSLHSLPLQDRSVLRYYTLIVMGIVVVLPMSLLRDIRKLSVAAGLSMIVYFTLVGYVSRLDG